MFLAYLLFSHPVQYRYLVDVNKIYQECPAFYSYAIGDIDSEKIYTQYNQDVYITPASCTKVLIAALAYKRLGRDFVYNTKVYTTNNGDILLSFSGDPTLTSEDIKKLLRAVSLKGKTIILDDTCFKTTPHSGYIMRADVGTWYGQPVTGTVVDNNQINVRVKPTKVGKKALVTNDCGYSIVSTLMTSSSPSKVILIWEGNVIKAKGTINNKEKALDYILSPPELEYYIVKKFKTILGGGKKIVIIRDHKKLPASKQKKSIHTSLPLKDFLPIAMKKSDNLVLDSLYLVLIHSQDVHEISEDCRSGSNVINMFIKQYFDVDLQEAVIIGGSGLPRHNRIKVIDFIRLLRRFNKIEGFKELLTVPNEVGTTLEKRGNLPAGLRAKSGTMIGVSTLCGYYKNKVFFIGAHKFPCPLKDIHPKQDKFLSYLLGKY